jgi:hypothetical protein
MASTTRSRIRCTKDEGVAVVMVALLVIPLVIFAAIGVDVASWHARVNYLQSTADAAATAGSVWMPNLVKATTVATESLALNGIVAGVNDVTVDISEGATATSLRVVVTDHSADRYLSKMFEGDQVLSRSAEAEYFLPLPLGSPLNYFGGDATRTASPIAWPMPYNNTGRPPAGPFGCNVGTSLAQGLGRWTTSSAYSATTFSGTVQCGWTAATTTVPPSPSTQHPSNVPCNLYQSSAGALGRWNTSASDAVSATYSGATRHTSGTGNRQCTWTLDGSEPSDFATRAPVNSPCNATGELADGRWESAAVRVADMLYRDPSGNHRLCQWTATTTAGANPITRSPGFWAQIHGPGADRQSGDAYSTKCETTQNCTVADNDLYVDSSDPNQGIWYVIQVPEDGGGPTSIRVFDASLLPGGNLSTGTGDSAIDSANLTFATSYRVYEQTNSYDFNSRTALGPATGDNIPSSCHWNLQQDVSFRLSWVDLCTVDMEAGERYLVNVRTAAPPGVANTAGRNSYAIEALTNGGAGTQPALYAYNKMVMYNNVSGGDATFYVAEVSPAYAGKTLVLELYDPGESTADAWLYPMMPSASSTGSPDHPPVDNCSFSSTRASFPRASDLNNGGECSVRTSNVGAPGGTPLYNNHWVTIRVTIPDDYTCTPGLNPEVDVGSCWWGIRYDFTGTATDTTTWQARVEGNPVHLTQ